MSTDVEQWFQPSLVIAIILASIAGCTLYIEWAIDRKMAAHELETSKAVAARYEEFRAIEKRFEIQLAEFRVRLEQVERNGKNGPNSGRQGENTATRGR